MKTRMQLIIGVCIGLTVGFGAGMYAARVRSNSGLPQLATLQESTRSAQLQELDNRVKQLRMDGVSDNHPTMLKLQMRIRDLEEKQRVK